MTNTRIGIFAPAAQTAPLDLDRVAELGIDHVCVGDHVSFFIGAGTDGLISATALLAHPSAPRVYVGLYLLPLRHPVPVSRQLATIAEIAPGRLTLGVGIAGEDRHEVEICGVDPATRGRRMNECMEILRGLASGEPYSFDGEFFSIADALIVPAPSPPIPLIVGGRSDAAVRRAALLGDGWLGIWVSTRRYTAVVEQIAELAAGAGRDASAMDHAMNVWCGFADNGDDARAALAEGMESFYRIPFENFERYSPYGTPADVAAFLAPYVEAGCSTFNVIPCCPDPDGAADAVGELRALLASDQVALR